MLRAKMKGATGEREVLALLQPTVRKIFEERSLPCPLLERNAMQFARGGFDIVGVDWCAIEVKRQENMQLEQWWRQACAQARGREPILFYRQNHRGWRVCVMARLGMWRKGIQDDEATLVHGRAEMSFDEFLPWFGLKTIQWARSLPDDWLPAEEAVYYTRLDMKKAPTRGLETKQKLAMGLIPSPPAGTIPPPWAC